MNYKVNITYKKVKNLTLRVKQDGTVNLTVPFGLSESEALKFVQKKEKWIQKSLEKVRRSKTSEESINGIKLVSGDILYYLGKSYTLKVGKSSVEKVVLSSSNIEIYVDNVDDFCEKREVLNNWYLSEAKIVFNEYIEKWEKTLNLRVSSITIRPMKTRWGSCNVRLRKINLNLELIRRDRECIDYVVLHEMAHLVHPNHSKSF
ncbi:M48 family metallopeptidase, partial [Clostridium cylindrosporum]|uniref:YgjP-like metallopeptidase domain-containing protein n=1 Tax=Clostridium cylindrosporum DSM 605 TaxID=1121307 RepID=A0A0J8D8K4_CLOCY